MKPRTALGWAVLVDFQRCPAGEGETTNSR